MAITQQTVYVDSDGKMWPTIEEANLAEARLLKQEEIKDLSRLLKQGLRQLNKKELPTSLDEISQLIQVAYTDIKAYYDSK